MLPLIDSDGVSVILARTEVLFYSDKRVMLPYGENNE